MIQGKTVLAIIPARGGSKGVPRKNLRLVAGKPLIAWTIAESGKSQYIDRTILSSDDEAIIAIARQWNCEVPFVRPAELAEDHVPGEEPVLHAIETINGKYDYVVLLQPTSPLRLVEDIDGCIDKCITQNAPACVTVTTPDKSPYWMYFLDNQGRLNPVIKQKKIPSLRQQLKSVYSLNGAVYVAKTDWFMKNKEFISDETVAYPMPKNRSIDIDTEWDLKICEILLSEREATNNSKDNV
jgi:CMP-N,N'-diacetyllegionaminic acid synthase